MLLDYLKRALGYFDSNGLRFSVDHLNRVNVKELLDKPMQIQAQYVDVVCFETVMNGQDMQYLDVLKKTLEQDDQHVIGVPATTTIGNLAFISLHSENLTLKRVAFDLLMKYKKKLNNAQPL